MTRLTLLAPANALTGYGQHATQLIRSLDKVGVFTSLRPLRVLNSASGAELPDDVRSRIVRSIQPEQWELLLAPPHTMPTPFKKTAYFTMSESTRLHPHSVGLINMADLVIVPSKWCTETFEQCKVVKPIRVVPLGIDPAVFFPARKVRNGVFGAAGRTRNGRDRKGLDDVIGAFLKAFPDNPNVRLEVKCHDDCAVVDVQDNRVKLLRGFWTDKQIAHWLNSIDAFVSAARGEAWGLWQHQAMACGCPVIAPIYGGLREFMDDDNSYPVDYVETQATEGWIGDWANPDEHSIVDHLRSVIDAPEVAKRKGEAAAAVAHLFTWERSVAQLLSVLGEFGATPQYPGTFAGPVLRQEKTYRPKIRPKEPPTFRFEHGLGDCANAATLFKAERELTGMAPRVCCASDKRILFEAAGCEVVESAARAHLWPHPQYGHALEPWSDNKTAYNSTVPMTKEFWGRLRNTSLSLPVNPRVSGATHITLLHSRGTTGAHWKNFNDELERGVYREFLERCPGVLVILDWHGRVCAPEKDYRIQIISPKTLEDLAGWMLSANLVVGVDSGPLHFARSLGVPALGCWFGLHPTAFALPSDKVAHICRRQHSHQNEYGSAAHYTSQIPFRRHHFNLIDVPEMNAETIVDWMHYALQKPQSGTSLAQCNFLRNLNYGTGPLGARVNRGDTAVEMLWRISGPSPVVVETGCVRQADDFGAGSFGYWMGWELSSCGGVLHTVDIDPERLKIAKSLTADFPVQYHQSDSVKWLREFDGKIDLLYLDSMDTDVPGHAHHCLKEVLAGVSKLQPEGTIVIDDTVRNGTGWVGKGRLAVPWLLKHGFKLLSEGYQCVLSRV